MKEYGGVKVKFLAVLIWAAGGEAVPDHVHALKKESQFLRSLDGKNSERRRIALAGN
jgi:hypothetical protein